MTCTTLAKDIDQSIAATSNVASDHVVFTRNATAYKIPFSAFSESLGVTGTLNAIGAPTATSILSKPSQGYNYIRGLAASQGITATLDPYGSIAIKTNLANSGGSAQIIKDTTAAQVGLRGVTAGDGITIEQRTNDILISTTTATASSNTVIVNAIGDLPDASGGVITLADDTQYFIATDISTSNRFVFGANCVITAADPFVTTLTYTGSGDMFTALGGAVGIRDIDIACPNGTVLNTDAATTGNLSINYVRMSEVKNLGSLNSPSTGIISLFIILHTGEGFTFGAAADKRFSMQTSTVISTTSATANFFNLGGGTFSAFNVSNLAFLSTVSGQNFMTGAAAGANLSTGVVGVVSTVTINGDMTGITTIANTDPGWDFTDNNKIGNTRAIALMVMSVPTTTTITTISTPVIVNGTFTDESSSLFTISAAGRVTYIGNRSIDADITASITFESASGTNTFEFYVAKNGAPILASGINREVTASTTANMSLIWDLPMVKDDYLELWVANITGTNDAGSIKIVARVK